MSVIQREEENGNIIGDNSNGNEELREKIDDNGGIPSNYKYFDYEKTWLTRRKKTINLLLKTDRFSNERAGRSERNPNDVVVALLLLLLYVCMYMTCVVQVFAFCALIQICTIIIILQ